MTEHQAPLQVDVEARAVGDTQATFVTPAGELDLSNADELAAILSSPPCSEAPGLVLDLRAVPFMDSSGFRVVMVAARDHEPRFAVLIAAESEVAKVIELVDVAGRLPVAFDEDGALRMVATVGPRVDP